MEAKAILRNCPLSARKMRLVVDLIRGKEVNEALGILKYTKKEAATFVEKTLLSALSNWENKTGYSASVDEHDLVVKTIYANEAGMLKRIQPAPQGRAHRIRKRSNHLTIVVENKQPLSNELELASSEEE